MTRAGLSGSIGRLHGSGEGHGIRTACIPALFEASKYAVGAWMRACAVNAVELAARMIQQCVTAELYGRFSHI